MGGARGDISLVRGGEWMRGLDLGITNPVETGGVAWARVWEGEVLLCVCVESLDTLCRWQVQVSVYCVDGYLSIIGSPSVHSSWNLSISAS